MGKHIQMHTHGSLLKYNKLQLYDGYLKKKKNFICGKQNFRNLTVFLQLPKKSCIWNMKQSWAGILGLNLTKYNRKLLGNYLEKNRRIKQEIIKILGWEQL